MTSGLPVLAVVPEEHSVAPSVLLQTLAADQLRLCNIVQCEHSSIMPNVAGQSPAASRGSAEATGNTSIPVEEVKKLETLLGTDFGSLSQAIGSSGALLPPPSMRVRSRRLHCCCAAVVQ